ncbi:carboxyl transferase domain-containing protein [Nonomuraea sp. NPDC050783]|uniref:carboxyl transferase domain-containing protein n=1 Tax=Nonomuraea sp. NPDC050783 TaxID=3154634 RepID=UPI0034661862
MTRPGARALIEATVDPGSFHSWDEPIDRTGLDADYRAALERAQARTGADEAVLTGRALIQGHPAALVVSEFGFLGGSIGVATAARVVAAVRRATRERLPLIAAPASGGTRMQEGTPAFVQMVEISRAVVAHKAAGLPYLVYLRHPTTGGVFASWGSLGHVSVAEPGALIGFLGPVVYRTLRGQPFPEGVQVAENLVDKGIVDAVVPVGELAGVAARALALLSGNASRSAAHPAARPAAHPAARPAARSVARPAVREEPPGRGPADGRDAWSSILLTRRPDRPGVRELLRYAADDVLPLNGTQSGETDDALLLALTSFSGTPCVLVGQDRRAQSQHRPLGPAALRGARRGMRIAQELGLPLICVIDTPGADLSAAAEEGALAGEIARCLAEMVELTVPTVSVLLGEGSGGGALALLPSRRVIAAGNAWLSPLPPEGASAILHGGPELAPLMARRQRVRAVDLLADGTVHAVVPEEVPAHEDPAGFARRVADECLRQIGRQRGATAGGPTGGPTGGPVGDLIGDPVGGPIDPPPRV